MISTRTFEIMPFNPQTSTPDVVENWPYDFQYIDPDAGSTSDVYDTLDIRATYDIEDGSLKLYEYLGAFATEMRRVDAFIDELYEQRFIETATGRELEKLGAPLGVTRRAGESDEELRYRVRLGKAVASSDGTARDIEAIMTIAFGEEKVEDIDVSMIDGDPIISFTIPEIYIEEIPIDESELNTILTSALPCGTASQVITGATFELGASGEKGLGEGNLT